MTELLLSFEGELEGSQTFTDTSGNGRDYGPSGSGSVVTLVDPLYNSGSVSFSGSGSISRTNEAWMDLNVPFTFECSINFTNYTTQQTLLSLRSGSTGLCLYCIGGQLRISHIGVADYDTTTANLVDGVRYDICMERGDDNNFRVMVNGTQAHPTAFTIPTNVPSSASMYLGAEEGTGRFVTGKMDEIRWTTGALYGGDYTPSLPFDGGSWTPAETTTSIWLDAADTGTITSDVDGVSNWADKSGNGYDVTQSSAAAKPTTGVTQINSENALDFDGGDWLVSVDDQPLLTEGEMFVVFRTNDHTQRQELFTKSSASGSNFEDFEWRFGIRAVDSAADGKLQYGGYGIATSQFIDASTNCASNTVYLTNFRYLTLDAEVFLDGTSVGTSTTSLQLGSGKSTSNRIWVGSSEGTTRWLDGSIAEIVVTPTALSVDDRQIMEGYLAHKWGLQAKLPVDHPIQGRSPRWRDRPRPRP